MSDKAEYLSGLPTTIYCTTLATGCSSPGRARHPAAGRSMPRGNPEGDAGQEAARSCRALSSRRSALTPGHASSPVLCPTRPNTSWIGADQDCGPTGCPPAQPLNLPSRRTLLLRALWQCSRGDGLMHENAAGRGCVAASLPSPWEILRRPMMGPTGAQYLSRKCCDKTKVATCRKSIIF